jgi:hypothetical protein
MITSQELSCPVLRAAVARGDRRQAQRHQLRATAGGNRQRHAVEFKVDNTVVKGVLEGSVMKGEAVHPDSTTKWTAVRIPPRPAQPRTHDFEPTEFHLYFSSKPKPVLRIHPGDSVRTWSVDAGGRDKAGNRRSGGGNPETGPFYVEGAVPGDTLVVRLLKLRLNRDWAGSGNSIMRNALEPSTVASAKWDNQFPNRWKLDSARGVATLEKASDALKNFTVPLQPMLGCIGVAPPGECGDPRDGLRPLRRQHGLQPDP